MHHSIISSGQAVPNSKILKHVSCSTITPQLYLISLFMTTPVNILKYCISKWKRTVIL